MKEDLDDKSKELKAAKVTQERLQEELGLRQTELEKISTLDVKIAEELASLRQRTAVMEVGRAAQGRGGEQWGAGAGCAAPQKTCILCWARLALCAVLVYHLACHPTTALLCAAGGGAPLPRH